MRGIKKPLGAWRWSSLAAIVLLAATGCTKSPPAEFNQNTMLMVSKAISPARQQQVANVLGAMYGTPDQPYALPETKLDQSMIEVAAGPVLSDESGAEKGLFRRHCAHCHGVTGDGDGPTARFLNPYPRDYRQGKFKFKSTERPERPTRDDLKRTLIDGIAGTAMPSFRLLKPREIDALVEYVVYLSMRGETEIGLADLIEFELDEDPEADKLSDHADELRDVVAGVAGKWSRAEEQIISPAAEYAPAPIDQRDPVALKDSIDKGRALFYGAKANCIKCHGPSAQGDGQTNDYDDWNKAVKEFEEKLEPPEDDAADFDEKWELYVLGWEAEQVALPVRTIRPRNLRLGVYRGGRRPLDLYRRLHAGINGTPMPGVGPATPGAKGTLSPEEIWNIVDYIQSLPFEPASEPPESLLNARERL
jgi:mono/diheme cytochrome c family protein